MKEPCPSYLFTHFFSKKICWKQKLWLNLHHKRNNIALFYTDSIHKIQKSPVRENKGLFFCPHPSKANKSTSQQVNKPTSQQVNKPTSQQANEPTSFRRSDEAEESVWVRFGSVWVRRVRLRELKHRCNPLKTQLTPIFLTNIPPHPLSQILRKKITQIQPIQQTKL